MLEVDNGLLKENKEIKIKAKYLVQLLNTQEQNVSQDSDKSICLYFFN